jgi:hypothetical protein
LGCPLIPSRKPEPLPAPLAALWRRACELRLEIRGLAGSDPEAATKVNDRWLAFTP